MLARSRAASARRSLSTLSAALQRAPPGALGLLAPQQGVAWSYGELDGRVRSLATGLRELGYAKDDVLVSNVPNTWENLVLQLALAHLGAAMATVKDADALAKLRGAKQDDVDD